ncbi:hypothetical protein OY671_008130, partial [Metschnikowia pulcherrima]
VGEVLGAWVRRDGLGLAWHGRLRRRPVQAEEAGDAFEEVAQVEGLGDDRVVGRVAAAHRTDLVHVGRHHGDARRVSNASAAAGIAPGERIATMGWNSGRHLAAWYGAAGMGVVSHTLNPRSFSEQIAYIANHAGDRSSIADPSTADSVAQSLPQVPSIERVIFFCDGASLPDTDYPAIAFDDWIADQPVEFVWGGFDENAACGSCYTSGTTGRPKGVMIEHRNIASLVASDIAEFASTTADRVVQGSSSAYDSSSEETWLAFATGATSSVMDDAAARSGPDIVGWSRDERATVFCPPPTSSRSSGCADPERASPDLKS